MKWAPEDRLNAYAATLLAEQPDPPRTVSLAGILTAYVFLAGLVVIPAALFAGAIVLSGRLLPFAILATGFVVLIAATQAQQIAVARNALQAGVAATGEVSRVDRGFRAAKILTLRVNSPGAVSETRTTRSGAANVLVPGDTVQLMLDPQTRQVLLILGLLKPSPLYAPPSP
jgi:hypothetical protein